MSNTPAQYPGIRVIDVAGLGEAALLVRATRQTILLIDSLLNPDDRMSVMSRAMDSEDAKAAS